VLVSLVLKKLIFPQVLKDFLLIVWNRKVHHRVHNSLTVEPDLSKTVYLMINYVLHHE